MKEFWNNRYADKYFAYGTLPNEFFKETLEKYSLEGTILFPAEGEGRNAVFASKNGLDVFAFDISNEGQNKAMALAAQENVSIEYFVGQLDDADYHENQFDAIVLIFAHFPPHLIQEVYNKLLSLLKPGGLLILEGFSENNLAMKKENPNVGGPQKKEMLFSIQKIKKAFSDLEILELEEKIIKLNEGIFHQGNGSVIRFVGRKK